MRTNGNRNSKPDSASSLQNRVLCILIFLVALAPRLVDLDNPGLTWDAPGYIYAGEVYISNILNFRLDPESWSPNWEHPPLAKYLMGISIYALTPLGVSEVAAARLPNAVLGALTCLAVYLLLRETYTEWVGVTGGLILSFLPRFFSDTRFAALDAPEAAFAAFAIYAFQKGVKSGKWLTASALLLGLALSVKISALTVPLVFLVWLVVTYRRRPASRRRVVKRVVLFPLLASATFVALWPLIWVRPGHILTFLGFHFQHFNISVYYLGTRYPNGPWHYPFVMTAVTTPVLVLFMALFGSLCAVKNLFTGADKKVVLLLVWISVSMLRVSLSYGYDGVRLFLDALPALAAISAVGMAWFVAILRRKLNLSLRSSKQIFILLGVLVVTSEIYGCLATHPYEASYYNEVLMATGGAKYFESTYWGETYKEVVEWMEENAPGSTLVVPIASHLPRYYAKTIRVLDTLDEAKGSKRLFFAFQAREGFYSWSPMIEYCLNHLEPVHVIQVNGLKVAYIYSLDGVNLP